MISKHEKQQTKERKQNTKYTKPEKITMCFRLLKRP
jgi:hypothetical protein